MDGRTFKAGALEEHRFIRNGNRDVLNSGIFIPDRFSICIPSRHCDDVVLGRVDMIRSGKGFKINVD